MSKIAAVPSLNKKGDTVLQPVKVQRYRRGQAPVGAASHHRSDDDDSESAEDGQQSSDEATRSEGGLALGGAHAKSLAVSRSLGFASTATKPKTAYVAIDVPNAPTSTAVAAHSAAAAASDPRLRRLAALAASTGGQQRRRTQTRSSGSESESSEDEEEKEEDVGRSRGGRGTATLEAQAERRLVLQQRLMEAEAAAQAEERMKGGKAVGERGSSGEESGSEEEEEESSESSSEEEQVPTVKIKPKFVPKFQRKTVPDPTTPALLESTTHPSAATSAARRAESRALVQSEIQRAQAEQAEHSQAISAVDDTDDVDPAAEYAAWRERELARLRRALALRRAYEAEQAELERRRNMTAEERVAEAERVAKEREEQQKNKPKVKFMQKYYHKGAFYMGEDVKDEHGVLKRDASAARPDHFNFEVVPEVLQKKNFGLAGQTKWTHLAKEDTSNRKEAGWFKDKAVVERMERKRGGIGDIDAGASRKRNRQD